MEEDFVATIGGRRFFIRDIENKQESKHEYSRIARNSEKLDEREFLKKAIKDLIALTEPAHAQELVSLNLPASAFRQTPFGEGQVVIQGMNFGRWTFEPEFIRARGGMEYQSLMPSRDKHDDETYASMLKENQAALNSLLVKHSGMLIKGAQMFLDNQGWMQIFYRNAELRIRPYYRHDNLHLDVKNRHFPILWYYFGINHPDAGIDYEIIGTREDEFLPKNVCQRNKTITIYRPSSAYCYHGEDPAFMLVSSNYSGNIRNIAEVDKDIASQFLEVTLDAMVFNADADYTTNVLENFVDASSNGDCASSSSYPVIYGTNFCILPADPCTTEGVAALRDHIVSSGCYALASAIARAGGGADPAVHVLASKELQQTSSSFFELEFCDLPFIPLENPDKEVAVGYRFINTRMQRMQAIQKRRQKAAEEQQQQETKKKRCRGK